MQLLARRWLTKASAGAPVPWTPVLAKRKDMFEISQAEAARRLESLESDAARRAREAIEGIGDQPEFEPVNDNARPSAEQVLAVTDKNDLESLGRIHGIELDKRKSVKTLQAELIAHLGA